jgi:hypothetical protein
MAVKISMLIKRGVVLCYLPAAHAGENQAIQVWRGGRHQIRDYSSLYAFLNLFMDPISACQIMRGDTPGKPQP